MSVSAEEHEDDLLPDGLTGSPPRGTPTISYWCKKCGGYLFTATNEWIGVTGSAVVHKRRSYRSGDVAMNLSPGIDKLDGRNKLKGCRISHLLCNGQNKTCKAKLAILCNNGTRKKRYKDWVFFRTPNIQIQRGRNYAPESFIIEGGPVDRDHVQQPAQRDIRPAPSRSRTQGSIRASTATTREPSLSSAPSRPATGATTENQEEEGGIDIRGSPEPDLDQPLQSPPSSQRIVPIRADAEREIGRGEATSPSRDRMKRKPSRFQASTKARRPGLNRRSSRSSVDTSESEEDPTAMIQPRAENLNRDELVEKLDNQNIQLQKQGLLLEKQEKTMATQTEAIKDLTSRLDILEERLKLQQQESTENLASLRLEMRHRTQMPTERVVSGVKRSFQQMDEGDKENESEPYKSPYEPSRPTHETDLAAIPSQARVPTQIPPRGEPPKQISNLRKALERDSIGPVNETADSQETSQETQAYLERTIRQDDSDDIDYHPTQKDSAISSTAALTRRSFETADPAVNRLLSPAHPLQRSPHSKITSASRFGPRPTNANAMQAGNVANATATSNRSHNSSSSHTGRLKSRGVSGGRTKNVVPQHLSHANVAAANANAGFSPNAVFTPATFEPNKKQRTDFGAGSFKKDVTPPDSTTGNMKGMRDAEGYLLKANGQRDLRSIRGRTLGFEAFRPTNGHRRTVASLTAEGYSPGSQIASPSASFNGTPTHSQPVQRAAAATTPSVAVPASTAAPASPWRGVTTIADAMAMMQGSPPRERQGQYDMAQEMERIQQRRLNDAMTKGPAIGMQYTTRHAEFMSKLGITDGK